MISGSQQRGVRRQAEVDLFAELRGALARVGDRRLQHREVQQRLAAEERQVRDRLAPDFREHEVDALRAPSPRS